MTSAQDGPQPRSRSKEIAQDMADAIISPASGEIIGVAAELGFGAAEALANAAAAASVESFEGGGGDFGGGGASGGWELPSISLPEMPDISLLDIGFDF